MSERLLLIDSDAFILLAGAGLLLRSIELLGFEPQDSRRLQALEPMLRKPARSLRRYPAEVVSRALEACKTIPALELLPDAGTQALFEGRIGVDAGEALLFGVVARHSLCLMASNDKTAMRTVATDPGLQELRSRVAGRVVCLESLTRLLLERDDPEAVARAFGGRFASDKRLAAILSMGMDGQPEECLAAVDSFLAGLRRELGADFLWSP